MTMPGFTSEASVSVTLNNYWMANRGLGAARNPVRPTFRTIHRVPFTSSIGLNAQCYFYCQETCAGSQTCLNNCVNKCSGPINIL
jgi:hypothetical protein